MDEIDSRVINKKNTAYSNEQTFHETESEWLEEKPLQKLGCIYLSAGFELLAHDERLLLQWLESCHILYSFQFQDHWLLRTSKCQPQKVMRGY